MRLDGNRQGNIYVDFSEIRQSATRRRSKRIHSAICLRFYPHHRHPRSRCHRRVANVILIFAGER